MESVIIFLKNIEEKRSLLRVDFENFGSFWVLIFYS